MNRSLMRRVIPVLLLAGSGVAWAQAAAELNGRVMDESGAVPPGVTVTARIPPSHNVAGGVNVSAAAGQVFGVAYRLDGAVHNNSRTSGDLPLRFLDALQDFRLATSTLSAENGTRSGGLGQRGDELGHQTTATGIC